MDPGTPTFAPDFAGAARRTVVCTIKARARRYARRPQELDALFLGLGFASPSTMIAVAAHLVEREARSPRRWFGFGGEVGLANARAALLLGRALWRATRARVMSPPAILPAERP